MNFCRKCGNKLQKDSTRCHTCGTESEKIHNGQISSVTDNEKILKEYYNVHSKNSNDEYDYKHKEEPLEFFKNINFIKKHKQNKIMLVVILLLIVIGASLIKNPIKNLFIRRDKVNWLMYAANRYNELNTVESESDFKIKFKLQSQEDVNYKNIEDAMEQCTLKLNTKTDKNTSERYSKASLIYKNKSILNAEIYSNKEYVAISAPQLYEHTMYIKLQDINRLVEEDNKQNNITSKKNSESVDLKKYENVFQLKNSQYYNNVEKGYRELFHKTMNDYLTEGDEVKLTVKDNGEQKTVKCDEVVLNLDNERIIKILKTFLQKISKDENLKLLIKEKEFQFLNIAEKNKELNKFDLSKEKVANIKTNFDSNYDSVMKRIGQVEKVDNKVSNEKINGLTKIRMDSKNNIRGFQSEFSIDNEKTCFNFISNTVINSINSKLDIKKIPKDGSKDMSKLTLDEKNDITEKINKNWEKFIEQKLNIKE